MSKPIDMEVVDRVWAEALAYMVKEGWTTHEADKEIADRLYRRWIRETDAAWQGSGFRDREPLRNAMEETFKQHYGEEGGAARLIIFTLLLEIRARTDGYTRPSSAEV